MCELNAYIYELCRHRGAAAVGGTRTCASSTKCLSQTNPYDLDFVLQEQPGFCPRCMLCFAEGRPVAAYKTPRVAELLDIATLDTSEPLALQATAVRARTFQPPPLKVAARSCARAGKTTPVQRRRRNTTGDFTPTSSALRPYARITVDSPVRNVDWDIETPTPTRPQRSIPHTPRSDLGTPSRGKKRRLEPETPATGALYSGLLAPPVKRSKSSIASGSSGSSSSSASSGCVQQKLNFRGNSYKVG